MRVATVKKPAYKQCTYNDRHLSMAFVLRALALAATFFLSTTTSDFGKRPLPSPLTRNHQMVNVVSFAPQLLSEWALRLEKHRRWMSSLTKQHHYYLNSLKSPKILMMFRCQTVMSSIRYPCKRTSCRWCDLSYPQCHFRYRLKKMTT